MTARIESGAGWTPGPWEFDGNCAGYISATALPYTPAIARAYSVGDARLIAAAPELVEALRNINATFEAYGKHRLPEYVRKEFAPIRALLARIQLGDSALGIEEAGE